MSHEQATSFMYQQPNPNNMLDTLADIGGRAMSEGQGLSKGLRSHERTEKKQDDFRQNFYGGHPAERHLRE